MSHITSLSRTLLLVSCLLGGLAGRGNAQDLTGQEVATSTEPELAETAHPLRWSLGHGVWLETQAWLGLDALTYPRTEMGFGSSQHANLVLRRAVVSQQIGLGPSLLFRFDVDLSEYDPIMEYAWVQYRPFPFLAVQAGRIQVPFGLAQMTSFSDLKLIGRPIVAGSAKDRRDAGLLLWGNLWGGRIGYRLGAVSGSRDLAVDVNDTPDGVGMLEVLPFLGGNPWIRDLRLVGFATYGSGPTRHGFRGRTTAEYTFFSPPTIRGVQWRAGGGLQWRTDHFQLVGEYQYINQERDGIEVSQRVGEQTRMVGELEPYVIQGYSIEGSWHIFGRRSLDRPITGLEVAARFEQLDLSDGEKLVETAEGTEDHAPLVEAGVDGITAGINAYFGHHLRLSLVWQGLFFSDETLAPNWEASTTDQTSGSQDSDLIHHWFLRIQGEI
ncbi:MAG: hypothetical protein JW797_01170 [Bradymonadales bacterium]|nr:hypothetical protein [Bradymonadales bacterium]